MGDFNQFMWIKRNTNLVRGPILEIGSKYYDKSTFINYRELFPDHDFVGVDLTEGVNVDLTLNITENIAKIREKLKKTSFQCIICCSVLEHIDNIFEASQNISNLVENEGVLFVSVPFIWEEHGYPNDFWRFTPNAIRYLFPKFKFADERSTISSQLAHHTEELNIGLNTFITGENYFAKNSAVKNYVLRKLMRLSMFIKEKHFRKEYLFRKFINDPGRYKKCCINMVGIKNE